MEQTRAKSDQQGAATDGGIVVTLPAEPGSDRPTDSGGRAGPDEQAAARLLAIASLRKMLLERLVGNMRRTAQGEAADRPPTVHSIEDAAMQAVRDVLSARECQFMSADEYGTDLRSAAMRAEMAGAGQRAPDEGPVLVVPVAGADTLHGLLRVTLEPLQATGSPATDEHAAEFLHEIAEVLTAAFEHDAAQRELEDQALHDALTGLPNRALLLDRLGHALRRRKPPHARTAVLFLDLDRLKHVNDGLGHSVGDKLLAAVGARLQAVLRPSDTIARIGGDEFAVVCEPVDSAEEALGLARRLDEALSAPFQVEGHEIAVTASIGVALGGKDDGVDAVLRNADRAMYQAKAHGRSRYELFTR